MIPERQRQQFAPGQVTLVRQDQPNNASVGERLANAVMHTEGQSQLDHHQAWIGTMIRATAKPNTKAAYEPKQLEFLEFCDEIYGNAATARHIDADKVYRFLFYVTHRKKKKPGPKKKGQKPAGSFDAEQYHKVWNTRRGVVISPDSGRVPPHQQFADLPEFQGESGCRVHLDE